MSDAELSKPSEPKDTGYTPGDDSGTRWRNTFNLLLGRLTDEGRAQYKKGRDDRYEKEDCEKCEKHRDYVLKYSMYNVNVCKEFGGLILCFPRPRRPLLATEHQSVGGQSTQGKCTLSTMHSGPIWGLRSKLRHLVMRESPSKSQRGGGHNGSWYPK